METVELRVHGVHGTSPGAMLGVADSAVGQVAGDGLTGIYRAKPESSLPYRDLAETSVSVEAYSWGALTSGVQGFLGWLKRALWLFLLPFALVNLAYWARIQLGSGSGQDRWGARAVRVSGLLLTVFFVLTPCVLAIDLAAWQCFRYGVPGCSRIPAQLDFVALWQPGQRTALATLVPMSVVAVLWLLSRASLSRYESVIDALDSPPALRSEPILLHPNLWNGTARTQRLQRQHLTAAVALVVVFSGLHLLRAARWPAPWGWPLLLWVSLSAGALLMLLAAALVSVAHRDDVEPPLATGYGGGPADTAAQIGAFVRALPPAFDTWVLRTALMTYAAHLVALSTVHVGLGRRVNESLDFTGRNIWLIAVFVGLTLLHLSVFAGGRMRARSAVAIVLTALLLVSVIGVLHGLGEFDEQHPWRIATAVVVAVGGWVALALWQYRWSPEDHHDKAWRGAGASVLLAAAAWIALLFTSSTVIATANYLNGPSHGVDDLVSRVEGRKVAPTTLGLDPKDDERAFVATGDITLRGARITVQGWEARVSSGTIEMTGLSLKVDPSRARKDDFTEGRGRTIVDKPATLTVPARAFTLVDSCLSAGSRTCTAEEPQFHSAGLLTLPPLPDDPDAPVEIAVDRGVALEPSDAPEVPLAVPQVLIWTPIGQVGWLVVVLVAVLVGVGLFRRRVRPRLAALLHDGTVPDDQVPPRDRARCLKARAGAALAHRSETLLDVVGAITSPVALTLIVASISGAPPWELPGAGWTRSLANVSMYLVVAMSAGLILLGSQIRRSEKTRKAVGVIWDLTTFWPRAAHPLAPPCYAERVVPELNIRTRWALDGAETNQVIVSGHSQGSLIVLAMVSRLNPGHLGRVRVITYGSQIRALYGRIFPRVFGPDVIGYRATEGQPSLVDAFPDVRRPENPAAGPPVPAVGTFRHRLVTAGGQWVNLFRRTDPLGWRVFSDVDSHLDLPVAEVPTLSAGDPGPQVMGHSGYQHSRAYRRVVQRWTGERYVAAPAGTRDVPQMPPL